MTVEPEGLGFDPQSVGTQGTSKQVLIHNAPGGSSLNYTVSLSAGDIDDFTLSCEGGGSGCLVGLVEPGSTATVLVSFFPTLAGPRSALLTVSGNDSLNPTDDVALEGTGVELIFRNGFEPIDQVSWSAIVGASDTEPPSEVPDLVAQTGTVAGSVDLTWTAPPEDGSGTNPASAYRVRFSLTDITTEEIWDNAFTFSNPPTPKAPGEIENLTVTGLEPGTFYYFAVRAVDELGQIGPIGPTSGAQAKPAD